MGLGSVFYGSFQLFLTSFRLFTTGFQKIPTHSLFIMRNRFVVKNLDFGICACCQCSVRLFVIRFTVASSRREFHGHETQELK